jgi:FAD/FMN-containing dehydrogenase/heterodisulfide reductase subunit C
VPLHGDTAVINTEKLEGLGAVEHAPPRRGGGRGALHPRRGRGGDAAGEERAEAAGYVFAVDPTSQDASTIGGNIAMNAGGKKAVLWGTTLDNLVSWRMVTPEASGWRWSAWTTTAARSTSRNRCASAPPLRGRRPHPGGEPELLVLPGKALRKEGLGKDVTDKFLGGLPGIQKEGCDGLITSAVFILHRMPAHVPAPCAWSSSAAISATCRAGHRRDQGLPGRPPDVVLSGLEHLDERYVRAVNYSTKAPRRELPKMVLLMDVSGDDEHAVAEPPRTWCAGQPARRRRLHRRQPRGAAQLLGRPRPHRRHRRPHQRLQDQRGRGHPPGALGEYNEGIERINIERSTRNKLAMIEAVLDYLGGDLPELRAAPDFEDSAETRAIVAGKQAAAREHLEQVRARWQQILKHREDPAAEHAELLDEALRAKLEPGVTLIQLLLRRELRISYRREVEQPLKEIFGGREFLPLHQRLDSIHRKLRSSRLFVATHMHAGDGNVHTNIPVNSNDYAMLHEAERIVDEVMALASALGGVISGEHGIGLTKMQYLEPSVVEAFAAYKRKVDPEGRFNRGKLMAGSGLDNAYTPSLRLVQQEALLLEESALGELNDDIRNCLRCGKCKPVCNTHIPRANLLYSPRNKILATGLIIEAFLYEEQTRRGLSVHHFAEMNDVADHCTICHKCLAPCPVNIDFGDVTMRMRNILRERGQKRSNIGTRMSMAFLNVTDPATIKLMRKGMIEWGYKGQRLGYRLARQLNWFRSEKRPLSTTGKMAVKEQVVNFIKRPMPASCRSRPPAPCWGWRTPRPCPSCATRPGSTTIPRRCSISPAAAPSACSARWGWPPWPCSTSRACRRCCRPATSAAATRSVRRRRAQGRKIVTDNRVLFHRVANTLNYLDIKTVIVSCGTCMDQLQSYEFEKIFPGCRLLDIHEYLMEKGVKLEGVKGVQYLYHDPCHTPMKTYNPTGVASKLMGQDGGPVGPLLRRGGHPGHLAPGHLHPDPLPQGGGDQAGHPRLHRRGARRGRQRQDADLLPRLPAGPDALRRRDGLETDYIVVELARHLLGEQWQEDFVSRARAGGIERVLL